MKIESATPVNNTVASDVKIADEPIPQVPKSTNTLPDVESKMTLDKATGLLQSIVSNEMSDKVIRKMPSDEYLHLLSLLDEIISGSIDKHV